MGLASRFFYRDDDGRSLPRALRRIGRSRGALNPGEKDEALLWASRGQRPGLQPRPEPETLGRYRTLFLKSASSG